jgi:AAHS family benzoate transporter-like MFS transporter
MSVEVQRRTETKSGKAVLALCFFSIVAEGYDMVAYGTSLPSMLADPSLGLTAVTAGLIGSYVLVGILVGSVGMGLIADFVGRRKLVIASTAWFSAWMVVCALAPNINTYSAIMWVG